MFAYQHAYSTHRLVEKKIDDSSICNALKDLLITWYKYNFYMELLTADVLSEIESENYLDKWNEIKVALKKRIKEQVKTLKQNTELRYWDFICNAHILSSYLKYQRVNQKDLQSETYVRAINYFTKKLIELWLLTLRQVLEKASVYTEVRVKTIPITYLGEGIYEQNKTCFGSGRVNAHNKFIMLNSPRFYAVGVETLDGNPLGRAILFFFGNRTVGLMNFYAKTPLKESHIRDYVLKALEQKYGKLTAKIDVQTICRLPIYVNEYPYLVAIGKGANEGQISPTILCNNYKFQCYRCGKEAFFQLCDIDRFIYRTETELYLNCGECW